MSDAPEDGDDLSPGEVLQADNVVQLETPKRKGGWPKGKPRGAKAAREAVEAPGAPFIAGAPPRPRQKNKKDLEGIVAGLVLGHTLLSLKIGDPTWQISEDEAYMLVKAGADLLDYYSVKIDGKNGAIIAVIYALTIIYGPRVFATIMKNKAANAEQRQAA